MITEWFLNLSATFMGWFGGLFDGFELPDWLVNLDDFWNKVADPIDGLAVWVPWTLVIGALVVCVSTYFVCLVIKYARAIASYIPFFGGAG